VALLCVVSSGIIPHSPAVRAMPPAGSGTSQDLLDMA
jgi:hypothetical protein